MDSDPDKRPIHAMLEGRRPFHDGVVPAWCHGMHAGKSHMTSETGTEDQFYIIHFKTR